MLASKKIDKNLILTVKYADYSGDTNATNVTRNAAAALSKDIKKFWLQAELKF